MPAWFKSTGATTGTQFNLDFPLGRAGMHGPPDLTPPGMPLGPDEFSSVTWTSPDNGVVNLSGGAWLMRKSLGRSMDWTLRVNGARISGGSLTSADSFTSSNPFDLANGDGGPPALNIAVSTGDIVALELGRPTSDASHEFVGVDFTITLDPVTEPSVYWTDVADPAGLQSVRRAMGDGSGVLTVATGLRHPRGLVLDPQHGFVYWAEPGALRIARTALDGNGPVESIVPTDNGSADVALDLVHGKMYWTDSNNNQIGTGINGGRIRRANLDGSQIEDIVNQDLRHPAAIALDIPSNKVYWTNLEGHLDGLGSIQRANLDGSGIETIVAGVDEANLALDLVHGKIYWTETATDRIQRANLDGSAVENVVIGLDNPISIDVDLISGKIYWTDASDSGQVNRIERANLDGSGREIVVSGIGFPLGIAVAPVPEPSSLALFSLSCLALGVRRFRLRPPRTQIRADYRSMRSSTSQSQ